MIQAGDLRNGITVEYENNIYTVIEFQHVKPGKGAAFVRAKIRNLKTSAVIERTFRPNEKMKKAHIERGDMEYLYTDGELFHFMNQENYEQIALNADVLGDSLKFVKENDVVKMLSYEDKVFGVEAPISVVLEVTFTEPGVKGDTSTGATKPATVETGAIVLVPLFINMGDKIKIDTRISEYVGRDNS